MFAGECLTECQFAVKGKKNEAVPPQHYLSPNQIKPNYLSDESLSVDKGKLLCVKPTTSGNFFLEKISSFYPR